MMVIIRECFGIETVGALREILDGVADETPLGDTGGEPLDMWFFEDHDSKQVHVVVE